MDIHSYPEWAAEVLSSTQAAKDRVVHHPLFLKMSHADLCSGYAAFFVGGLARD
jgi:hypothetical protein